MLVHRIIIIFCRFKILLIFIFFLFFIIIYGFYLDSIIYDRISNKKVWSLPYIIYTRIINLYPGMLLSLKDLIVLLEHHKYRQVINLTRPGEFKINSNYNIEVFRRAFNFPDSNESEIHVILLFSKNHLMRILHYDTNLDFGYFRLDPRVITLNSYFNTQKRLFILRKDFPDILIKMLIKVEDKYFYRHDGIHFISIIRALFKNIISGYIVQGGSTLSQQLIKNLFLHSKKSLLRKAKEIYMAFILECRYSKDYILEIYLNEIYFGQTRWGEEIRGFPLASLYYFGYPITEISLDQQALLIGMLKGASLYNPLRNPDLILHRRNFILKLIMKNKIIDNYSYILFKNRPLGIQKNNKDFSVLPSFMSVIHRELKNKLGNKLKKINGLKIFSTLDLITQRVSEKSVKNTIYKLRKSTNSSKLETAMVVVDKSNGEIRALVGGSKPSFLGLNRAINIRRPIGSLIKPVIYLSALSCPMYYNLSSWILDKPIVLNQSKHSIWKPNNFDKVFRGRVMLLDAFTKSLNIPTINLGLSIGIDNIVENLVKLGLSSVFIHTMPSMLLGTINLTPLEVAQIFQTIGNLGIYSKVFTIKAVMDNHDNILYCNKDDIDIQMKQMFLQQSVYLILYAMQKVVINGTACILSKSFSNLNLAVKTGTTNNLRDSWVSGIDGNEVCVIWIGNDDNTTTNLTGSNGALLIYTNYLKEKSISKLNLKIPRSIFFKEFFFNKMNQKIISNNQLKQLKIPIWNIKKN